MNKPTHKRDRYQSGSLKIEKRNAGVDMWVYRWREYRHDGTSTYRKKIIGPVSELRTKAAAQKAVESLKLDINATVSAVPVSRSVEEIASHFKTNELQSDKRTAKTIKVYGYIINDFILPVWGKFRLRDVKTIAVERWLESMSYAPATKNHIKGAFSRLFRHAMRYEWAAANPITLVRCSSKRVSTPDILTPTEIRAILGELAEPARTVTMLAAITGLRRSELFGLKWSDLCFERKIIRIVRSLVDQIEGKPKTETSRKPLPMSDDLASALSKWREQTSYAKPSDWVFASPTSFGKLPYWPDMVLRRHIVPAAERLGITKRIGWHTFRRTAATLLHSSGASLKTTQELMRHATADITLELYAQAVDADKREAQNSLSALITGQTIPPMQGAEIAAEAQLNLSAPALAPTLLAHAS